MAFFVSTTPAPTVAKGVWFASIATAGVLVLLAVAQLFTYEKFPAVLDDLWMSDNLMMTQILAASIVVCEIFALPFLLSMRLSPLMRFVSMACGWFVAFVWLLVTFWQVMQPGSAANVGILGATVPLAEGLSVLLAVIVAVGVGYVSWSVNAGALARKEKK